MSISPPSRRADDLPPLRGPGPGLQLALQRIAWRTPEWWAAAVALAVWVALIAVDLGPAGPAALAGHQHHAVSPAPASDSLVIEVCCVFGMMLPVVLPPLRGVAFASLWARRNRAMAMFVTGYLAIWIAASVAIGGVIDGITGTTGPLASVGLAGVVAIGWQLTAKKRKALRGCHLMLPLAPSGWGADRDCLALGVAVGRSCVLNCWALMTVVFAAGHHPVVMLGVLGLMVIERFGRNAFGDAASAIAAEIRFAFSPARIPTGARRSSRGPLGLVARSVSVDRIGRSPRWRRPRQRP